MGLSDGKFVCLLLLKLVVVGNLLKPTCFSLASSVMGTFFFSEQKSSWKKRINLVIFSFVALLYMFYDDCTMFAYLVFPLSLSD